MVKLKVRTYVNKFGEVKEEVILDKGDEQKHWYDTCVNRVMFNTREILDNLDLLPEFKVNWENYHRKGYYKEYKLRKKKTLISPATQTKYK